VKAVAVEAREEVEAKVEAKEGVEVGPQVEVEVEAKAGVWAKLEMRVSAMVVVAAAAAKA